MSTAIILLILVVIVIFALKSSLQHMKGIGGCCGGGSTLKADKKKLTEPIVAKRVISVEGMHCENCKNKIERAINSLDGAVGKVNLNKKIVTVSMSTLIDDDTLKNVIESLDFKVIDIK